MVDWLAIIQVVGSLVILPLATTLIWALLYLHGRNEKLDDKVEKLQLKIAEEYTPLRRHLDSEKNLTEAIKELTAKIDTFMTALVSKNG